MIQLGAIAATLLYFARDIVRLVLAWVRGLRNRTAREEPDYRLAWYVIAGSLPIAVVGFLARDLITGPLRNLWVVVGGAARLERGDVVGRGQGHPAPRRAGHADARRAGHRRWCSASR